MMSIRARVAKRSRWDNARLNNCSIIAAAGVVTDAYPLDKRGRSNRSDEG